MIDTGHVGAASDNIAEATQRIATIVANAQAARHFLDHRPPDLDEVRQALDCIVEKPWKFEFLCLGGTVDQVSGAVFTGLREFFAYLSAVWAPRHCYAAINLGMRIRL